MAEEKVEEEYQEVKERRGKSLTQLFKNISSSQFIAIIILGIIFIYLLGDKTTPKTHLFIIGFSIIVILLYSQKAGNSGLISEEVAKKIAIECLENKKEDYHIPSDADITPTNFCVLQYMMTEPLKWHIGIKIVTSEGKIDYWRVIIHPYEGIVLGIVNTPLGFDGKESEVRDRIIVSPEHFIEEK